jgi:hypothetical protein
MLHFNGFIYRYVSYFCIFIHRFLELLMCMTLLDYCFSCLIFAGKTLHTYSKCYKQIFVFN